MNDDECTDRTRALLQEARELTEERGHAQVTPWHLTHALLADPRGMGALLVDEMHGDAGGVRQDVDHQLQTISAQSPAPDSVAIDSALTEVLKYANKLRKEMKDTHVAIETVFLALFSDAGVAAVLKTHGMDESKMKEALKAIRAGRTVTSANAEETYDALKKYGQNLWKQAGAV